MADVDKYFNVALEITKEAGKVSHTLRTIIFIVPPSHRAIRSSFRKIVRNFFFAVKLPNLSKNGH